MMIFDINCAIGHYPFRQLPNRTAAELRRYLEQHGVGGAAVAHTHGVFYNDAQVANLELAGELEANHDFFVGVATLNPTYAAAARNLDFCVRQLDFRALRLLPKYHNYELDDPAAIELVHAAGELKIPVMLPNEIVNFRQKHHLEPDLPLGLQAVAALAKKFPAVNFIFTETAVTAAQLTEVGGGDDLPNVHFEISRFRSAYGQILADFVRSIGAARMLFGSGSPFKAAEGALLKLHCCELPDKELAMIASGNARRLLYLD